MLGEVAKLVTVSVLVSAAYHKPNGNANVTWGKV